MKKAKTRLIPVACTLAILAPWPATAQDTNLEVPSLQASSTIPVNDNRIAALWAVTPNAEDPQAPLIKPECTASYLGNSFWITAQHCIATNPAMIGFLRQSDGEVAGIAAIYTASPTDDIALIKVGAGINADPFTLANEPLHIGDQAELTGYGQPHDYASTALTAITGTIEFLNFGNVTYTDLYKGISVTTSRSCSGDSGAPVYKGDVLYAIHTAGGFNQECSDGYNRPMWHTNIVPRTYWIKETILNNVGLIDQEKARAHVGLEYATALFPHVTRPQVPYKYKSSSSSFHLSSMR